MERRAESVLTLVEAICKPHAPTQTTPGIDDLPQNIRNTVKTVVKAKMVRTKSSIDELKYLIIRSVSRIAVLVMTVKTLEAKIK